MNDVKKPLNTQEEYMYAMVVRLDALCHMVSSLVDEIGKQKNVAVESNTVKKKTAPRKKVTKDES